VPRPDGNYFLRPDLVKAAFLLDGTSGLPGNRTEALEGLAAEKANDKAVQVGEVGATALVQSRACWGALD